MTNDEANELEQDFIASWDRVGNFYLLQWSWGTPEWYKLTGFDPSEIEKLNLDLADHNARYQWLIPIQGLIADMRERGYDRQLRAGQSMDRLVLSRSRQHGLRHDQSALSIDLYPEGGMIVQYWEHLSTPEEIKMERVEFTPELEELLTRLLAQPID